MKPTGTIDPRREGDFLTAYLLSEETGEMKIGSIHMNAVEINPECQTEFLKLMVQVGVLVRHQLMRS